ncbi:MAG TPA: FAD binding domain-containing protein [Burkholderiaceae bacterium]|jgi:2-furoyl-CoA dehydrogenase FAD binding subunit|nr:FAD binding domain-containing protein [Burkholderiaceae bacterium]
MKPPRFDLLRADDAAEAVEALRARGDEAKVLAGGQSLMTVLNMRLATPSALIDITRCEDLRSVRLERDALVVGAAVTQMTVERRASLAREVPLLAQALPWISHQQIRSRGTVCGSIAHADPAAELPLVLATLGGSVTLRSTRGRRSVAAEDFFTGMLSTVRADDELVEDVRFPLANERSGFAFNEFALRHGDFAIVAVAVAREPAALRIGIGGVADRPVVKRLPPLDGCALDDALNELAWSLDARDDPHMTAQGRRHLVRRLGRQAVLAAAQGLGSLH